MAINLTVPIHIDNPNDGPHECDAKCWPVTIVAGAADEIEGAIVVPLVEGYPLAQIEVIARLCVRAAAGIEDGDSVTLILKD